MSTRVVDTETGEVVDRCDRCAASEQENLTLAREVERLEDVVNGLQRDIAGWTIRYAELKRDKDAEAREHPLWGDAETVFNEWRLQCNHKRSKFNAERFWLVLPHLEKRGYGMKACITAIRGAAFDPFTVRRKNGSTKRFDEFERIFKDFGSLEDFANRAPLEQQQLAVG